LTVDWVLDQNGSQFGAEWRAIWSRIERRLDLDQNGTVHGVEWSAIWSSSRIESRTVLDQNGAQFGAEWRDEQFWIRTEQYAWSRMERNLEQ
jgi:hypothetical protein